MSRFKTKPYRSKEFLAWAKRQHGPCCVCPDNPGSELHHFGDKGMGQKATDLKVCRVCPRCHGQIAGKRRRAFERLGDLDTWIAIVADGLELLAGYVEHLEARRPGRQDDDDDDSEIF